jgi:chromosome segregation ATPase
MNDMLAASCNELSKRADNIDTLQRTVLSCEACIEDHEAAKAELETEISSEQQEVANLECQLHEARSELEQAGLEVAKTSSELTETRGALETLQGAFAEKTDLAETLRGARDDAHARLVFLTGKLEEASRDE